jgi:phosphoserine phosphatase RsbU/P
MQAFLRQLRLRIERLDLVPRSQFARVTCYLVIVDFVLFGLERLFSLLHFSFGSQLDVWIWFLSAAIAVLLCVLALRWLKARLLWRLRNRLIVTYIFIGAIPVVLLIAMGFISLYLFAGQFANFAVTSELNLRLQSLQQGNAAIAYGAAMRMENGQSPAGLLRGMQERNSFGANRIICVWNNDALVAPCVGSKLSTPFSRQSGDKLQNGLLVQDHGQLYLRAVTTMQAQHATLTVISSELLGHDLLEQIAAGLGEITLYSRKIRPQLREAAPEELQALPDDNAEYNLHAVYSVGSLPQPTNILDREIKFGTPLFVMDWATGQRGEISSALRVRTRPSLLYGRLFGAMGQFAQGIEYLLFFLLFIFTLIVALALVVGARLTRSMTYAVAQLYDATGRVNRGDLSHRIPVKSNDQLAELANSFNSMTASLDHLLQEQREKQKMENELVIAQEVQAQLFPRESSELESLEVHGFCRPARTVSGDYYDFLTVNSETLILAVGDVSGKGISAALLMATIHSAVRAYSLEGIPLVREMMAAGSSSNSEIIMASRTQGAEVSPGKLLALLNHQLYQSTPQEKYATMFLGFYDGLKRQLTYSNGGHLPPILLRSDGSTRRLDCGGTVVGMFDDCAYPEASVELYDGEIFLAYSDGVTEPENDYGEFGEQRLIELVWANRHLPLARITEIVTAAVDDWIGENEQPDDITLVLARAR